MEERRRRQLLYKGVELLYKPCILYGFEASQPHILSRSTIPALPTGGEVSV